jgi:anti-sigma factor RsiW
MTCKETQSFMDGYFDRELDLVRSIDLERHLHDCPACAELHKSRMAVRGALGASDLRYQAPAALRASVRAKLAEAAPQPKRNAGWFYIPAIAAMAAVAVFIFMRPDVNRMERDVVDSHIRSLMPGHLIDVQSTDQHTVKPWFAGKLDFSPPVRDFAAEGFPLIGGRVDYFGDHPVAAVVYQRNKHVINLFAWRSAETTRAERTMRDHGYNLVHLARDGSEYWIVSDLNAEELQQFAKLVLGA